MKKIFITLLVLVLLGVSAVLMLTKNNKSEVAPPVPSTEKVTGQKKLMNKQVL